MHWSENYDIKLQLSTISISNFGVVMPPNDRLEAVLNNIVETHHAHGNVVKGASNSIVNQIMYN